VRARVAGLVMAALLVLYLAFVTQYAFVLMGVGGIATVMGIALLVLPLIGAFVLTAELLFVFRGERLLRIVRDEGGLPVDDLPRLPSGRPDPVVADERFPAFRAAVEADPGSWRAWLLLGLAYDASGDRARARWATRSAISLERATRAK
jgi:hypothetical protein